MTITWHVDDLKVSHKDAFKLTQFGLWLEGIYEIFLTVHRGKVYDYLEMDLDYSEKVSVKALMIKYLKSSLCNLKNKLGSQRPVQHLIGCYN